MSEINMPIVIRTGGNVKGELSTAQSLIEAALYRSSSILRLINVAAEAAALNGKNMVEVLEDIQNACEICVALEDSVFESFKPISHLIFDKEVKTV